MADYDVILIGGSTAGSYFARRMAEQGLSVLVLEKASRETISPAYDIFHMGAGEMEQFGLPPVSEGDGCFAFSFCENETRSAFGNYPKPSHDRVVGMHKRAYIQRLNDWAVEAGAELLYEAEFLTFLYGDDGKICGVRYRYGGEACERSCRLAVDCSGIPAVGRRSLPDSYGVEKFELTPDDLFFVVLRYIRFHAEKIGWASWIFYKTWFAPAGDGADGILGVGANFGFDYAEKIFGIFSKNVKLPAYDVVRTERGATPYHRTVYSFVGDGFLALGDAASLTKPFNGEGCTATMVLCDIASDVAGAVLKSGAEPTREALWPINKRYNDGQGKDFAAMLALLCRVVRHTEKANEFFFRHDVVFSQKILGGFADGMKFTPADVCKTVLFIAVGICSGKVKPGEIGQIFAGALNAGRLLFHYRDYPETPAGFEAWVQKADALWAKAGKMSDWKV